MYIIDKVSQSVKKAARFLSIELYFIANKLAESSVWQKIMYRHFKKQFFSIIFSRKICSFVYYETN